MTPKPLPALEVLRTARELILDPNKWCQNAFFTDDGKLCSSGAIRRASGPEHAFMYAHEPAYEALMTAMDVKKYEVCIFNDTHTHAEVIAAFDKAIAAVEKVNHE